MYIPDKYSYMGFHFTNIYYFAEKEETNDCSNYESVWNSLDYGLHEVSQAFVCTGKQK
jgi:hypothetical protein